MKSCNDSQIRSLLKMAGPLVLAGCLASAAQAQTVPTDWEILDSGGIIQTSTAYAALGSQSLAIDSTGAGAWSSPQVYQSFPAAPGDSFDASGEMLMPASDPITDGSFGVLKVVFRNSLGADLIPASIGAKGQINTGFPGGETLPFVNNASTPDTWVLTELLDLVAPAGTVEVVLLVLNVNQNTNPTPIYYDNIILTRNDASPNLIDAAILNGSFESNVPPPPEAPIVSIGLDGEDVVLSFDSLAGTEYSVESSALVASGFSSTGLVVGGIDGLQTAVVADAAPAAGAKSFFRLQTSPTVVGDPVTGPILLNAAFAGTCPANPANWEAYATFTADAGSPIAPLTIADSWSVCAAPFTRVVSGTANFGMNESLVADAGPDWDNATQDVAVFQNFYTPDNPLGIRPFVNSYGQKIIFEGFVTINEAYAPGATGEVYIGFIDQGFNLIPGGAVKLVSGQSLGSPVAFSLEADIPLAGLHAVQVGFRNTGIVQDAGQMQVSGLSASLAEIVGFTGDLMVNGSFNQGTNNLDGWNGYQGAPIVPLSGLPVTANGGGTAVFSVNTNVAPAFFQQDYWVLGNSANVSPSYDLAGQVVTFSGNVIGAGYDAGSSGYVGIQFLDTSYSPTAETVWVDISDVNDATSNDGILMNSPNPGDFSITVTVPTTPQLNIVQAEFRNISSGAGATGAMTITGPLLFDVANP